MKAAKKLLIPLLSLALFLGLFNTVFFWGYIPSSSMEPTIHKGDVILGLRLFRELHNGDIIIFERDGRYLVKRIAASSGDSVAIQRYLRKTHMLCVFPAKPCFADTHFMRVEI